MGALAILSQAIGVIIIGVSKKQTTGYLKAGKTTHCIVQHIGSSQGDQVAN